MRQYWQGMWAAYLASAYRRTVDELAEHRLCGHITQALPRPVHCDAPAWWKVIGLAEEDEPWRCPDHTFVCPPACPLCKADLRSQGNPRNHSDIHTGTPCRFTWRAP